MWLGCGIIFIGPRKSNRRLRAKGYYRVSVTFKRLRFIFHRKIANIVYDGHSFINELLLSYTNTFKERSLDGLPEVLALFDPHKYAPGEFLKRFRAKRSRDGSRERQSGALLAESIVEFHDEKTIDMK
jgi:hypothetical protein